ncbi:glycosyltransferase family 8 protein [Streptococcus sp. SPS1]|uniref:glycosyltransferase family 8 protein n=1 Tax=Streptococcus sp. SPS1 TaxID=3018247 RepID=UPI00263D18A0|nr:glycosyltransferase family 8 protein [Streptococcus sp. SPS1]MDN5026917.1 glycosyltransferase family 8 protein [Streptococcus sp. SPS1]
MNKATFVLAADYGYLRYLEATLKSVCYHHDNCKVYIMNRDIPQEWFIGIRKRLKCRNSELVDIKLTGDAISKEWKMAPYGCHINYMTFARYFIPQFVEEEKVLYLDSDVIVTRNLNDLFKIELGNHLVAAAKVVYGLEDRFNAGVLLINNKLWKAENIQRQCIDITNNEHETLIEADQTVLNRLCGQRYIVLDDTYNFQIGYDRLAEQRKQYFILEKSLNPLPAIIHYLSDDKPWNLFSFCRLRDVWWKYSLMDWSEIIAHEIPKTFKSILIMTHSQELEQIEILMRRLPECTFNIMALTLMGDKLNSLRKYENVRLHPAVLEWNINRLIRECDVYLDINHEVKNLEVIEKVKESGKLILSFENTANEYYTDKVFNLSEIEQMIEHIKSV